MVYFFFFSNTVELGITTVVIIQCNATFIKRIHALQPGGPDKLNIPTARAMNLSSIMPFAFYNCTVSHQSQSHIQLQVNPHLWVQFFLGRNHQD